MASGDRWVRGSAFVVLLGLAGCGGGGAAPAAPATATDFTRGLVAAICKYDVACGTMPDMATCQAALLPSGNTDELTVNADVAAGKVHYDRAKAATCLDLFGAGFYDAGCKFSAAPNIPGGGVCQEVLTGTVADGGACFLSFECASASCTQADKACAPAHQCCPGTCAPKAVPIAVGGDCSAPQPGQGCATGALCLTTAAAPTARCVLPSTVKGSACASPYECAAPLFCDAGTCQPAVATGGACNASALYGACDDLHDYCDKTTHVCTRLGAVGDPCDSTQRNCLGYAQCAGSICVAKSSERGACDATNGPGCLGNLQCFTTTSTCGFPANASACQ